MNIFGSLLFLHGHVASAELARQLAGPSTPPPCRIVPVLPGAPSADRPPQDARRR
ncbi:hypothetical protein [uncultured Stenotrophomonas sp.]|uniref:hypothetical protein n=1 Tax=uncultured Stenotrophomonas sp. TaxID=165438 RepID=UPI0025E41B00|nr:hypothetical protein [uncultured Stenotrophomonas sp.]